MKGVRSNKLMCAIAFKSLECQLNNQKMSQEIIKKLPNINTKIFVTYHEEGELRGCIGTFQEQQLRQQLPQYAIIAALQDYRFEPISENELEKLDVTVSLLVDFEECQCLDWEIGVHGIEIEYKGRGATFLPEVSKEQGWDQKTTLQYLLRKAGVKKQFTEDMIPEIHCIRYKSSTCNMTYKEYQQYNFE